MPRPQKSFNVYRRKDTGTFQFSINPPSGVPAGVCREWQRRSSQDFPPELAQYRNPKNRTMAENAAMALINLLLKDAGKPVIPLDRTSVGSWLALFTSIETSPRAARNVAKGRPYSIDTIQNYQCYYRVHLKGDPLMDIKMDEVDETRVLQFISRLSNHHIMRSKERDARLAGTDTLGKILKFVRMAFTEYQKTHHRWVNPFQTIESPQVRRGIRDALSEEEVISLFSPGVLRDTMEVAVCAAMFLAGLRRSEIFALNPENLDWNTPKIEVLSAWQCFDSKSRVLGPPKGKRSRQAPFDKVLQKAIKKLWQENGRHEFVFAFKDGTTPGPSWIKGRFKKWLARAGIDLRGRRIVPHSARHSLASILEERGVSLRYIQDLLGHSDLQTTKLYLHSTEKTIRDIGSKIDAAMEAPEPEQLPGIVRKTG